MRRARRWLLLLLLLLQVAPPVRGWTLLNLYHESLQAKTGAPYRDPVTDTPWDGPQAWNLSRIAVRWEPLHASEGASTRRLVSIAYALHPDMCSDWLEMPATATRRRRTIGASPRTWASARASSPATPSAASCRLASRSGRRSTRSSTSTTYRSVPRGADAAECAHAQLVVRGMTPQEQRELDDLGLNLVAAVHLDRVTVDARD